jgi:hypothetical protein
MEMVNVKDARIDSCTQFWFNHGKNKKNIGSQMGKTNKKRKEKKFII